MRPVTLNLGVLVRDPVNDNAWPGVDEVIEFNDTTCPAVDDEETNWLVEQVFVVMGYDSNQGDSVPAPAGWQIFTVEEATQLIPGWAADSLEFHAATKITCSNDPDNFYIVGDSFFDVVNAFNTCCGAPNIQTQALALKQSNNPLEPGTEPPCGTQAAFKWLAIRGNNETRNLVYTFQAILQSADMSPFLTEIFQFPNQDILTQTMQATRNWPDNFIGLTSLAGITLVANNTEDADMGPNDRRISAYDFGTISMLTSIEEDLGGGNFANVSGASETAALPGTLCGAGCVSPYPAITTLPGGTVGTPYSQNIQLQGQGPFAISVGNKPSWMTVSAPDINGQVTLTGTPDAAVNDFEFIYTAANCGNALDNTNEHTLLLDIQQAFLVQTHANPSALNFSESIYVPFLDLFMAFSGSDDASGTRVATSPDGVTWTLQNTGAFTGSLQEAAAGPDRVIFVGSGGTALMTVDGINFTTFTMPQAIQHTGITYDPNFGLFVIVAQQGSNRVFTTVDGSSVNTITAPALNNWSNVTFNTDLNLLVACAANGSGNQIMTSDDGGTTWTLQSTPTPARLWRKIKFLNGRMFVLSQDGTERIMYSDDAVNWVLVNFATFGISASFFGTDIGYGNGLLVIVSSTGAGPIPSFLYSTNGGTIWSNGGTNPAQQWTGVNFKQSLNRFSVTGLGPGSGFRVATIDWLP